MPAFPIPRRAFLSTLTAGFAASFCPSIAQAQEPPHVTDPRATDGDESHEPNWEEKLTITVGPPSVGKNADMLGDSDKVLQAAVDYVARLGGGTVKVLPGVYPLRSAIFLPSNIRLLGSGADSIITKIPSQTVALAADSDWYDQEITLEDAADFRVGDSVVLRAKNPHNGATETIKRVLLARSGKRFKLSDGLRKNLWLSEKPTCSSLFPLLTSEYTSDVVIENITLDGNRKNNERLDGNYAGCVFLQDCNRYTIRNVEARNYNGDGVSFQICHDVRVEKCHSHDNADLGLHPGSGSQRPVILNNQLERNTIGLFWCWGVKFGLAEGNRMVSNRDYGVSIGHCDTDNVMRNNEIIDSGKIGVLFRNDARGQDFWANRNLLENNRIINSGADEGVAVDIQGKTKDVRLTSNEILEKREPLKRIGVRISADADHIELLDNTIKGFAQPIVDHRA